MNSWSELMAMGGYGLYVWGSLGVVVLCAAVELIGLQWRFQSLIRKKR